MKSFVRLAAVAAALAVAAPASAQQQTQNAAPKIGFGIAVTPVDTILNGGVPPVEIYVPIGIAPQFRIEPSLGIFTFDQTGNELSNVTLGIGAFFLNRLAPQVDMYAGGRLKLNFASFDNGVNDDSDTDFFLAAALGGEYYFVPKFSIGLEGNLGYYSLGDVSGGGDGADGFFTSGLAFLRVYF
jgi:Outer membrane protein beta-barrel domain